MRLPVPPNQEFADIIKSANGKFVTLCYLARENITIDFDKCKEDLLAYSGHHGFKVLIQRLQSSDVERGRYDLLRNGFLGDALLWIDSDQTVPPDTLVRLFSHNLPIVGTIVVAKQPPHFVVSGVGDEKRGIRPILTWPNNALIEVDATGFGCCLIRREVFEAFPEGNPFLKVFCESTADHFGEDWSFCIRAKRLGFQTYVDTGIPIGHVGHYIYTIQDYQLYHDLAVEGSKETLDYEERMNPKVFRRVEQHPKMKNLIWTKNKEISKPRNRLVLMGENGR